MSTIQSPFPTALVAELRSRLAQSGHDVSYEQWHGLVSGLKVTGNAAPEEALTLLGLQSGAEQLPQLTRALLELWPEDATSTAHLGEVVESVESVTAWLSGVGQAVAMEIQKLFFVFAGPQEFQAVQQAVLVSLAFAPSDLTVDLPPFQQAYEDVRRTMPEVLGNDSLEERALTLQELLVELRLGFDLADQVTANLDGKWGGSPLAGGTVRRAGPKVRPNEACPCGSGRKFKKCCGKPGAGGR